MPGPVHSGSAASSATSKSVRPIQWIDLTLARRPDRDGAATAALVTVSLKRETGFLQHRSAYGVPGETRFLRCPLHAARAAQNAVRQEAGHTQHADAQQAQ